MKSPTIVQNHANNFKTLQRAFGAGNVALMECTEIATGQKLAVVCAVEYDDNTDEYIFTPFCSMLNGNPFNLLTPPEKD